MHPRKKGRKKKSEKHSPVCLTPMSAQEIQAAGISPLYDPREAAAYIKSNPQTLARYRSTGIVKIPFIKIGGMVRYRKSDLDAFLDGLTRVQTA